MIPESEIQFDRLVRHELMAARMGHKPIVSVHEGYSIILEELDEFWAEVKKRKEKRSPQAMLMELVQLAAMAQRTAEDVIILLVINQP